MSKRKRRRAQQAPEKPAGPLPPHRCEALLLEQALELPGTRILTTTLGRAQLARACAELRPEAAVCCAFLDAFPHAQALAELEAPLPSLSLVCQPDFPPEERDLVLLPIRAKGEGELTRDLIQQALGLLRQGGRLLVATDNPKDTWLHDLLKKLARPVSRYPHAPAGVVYAITKTKPLKKLKDYRCEFAFRDRGTLIRALSRPGVFAHRRLDGGARALIEAMQVEAGQRVLDVGCGSGAAALAAASIAPEVQVHAIDSNSRAVECVRAGAALNDLENLSAEQALADTYQPESSYDVVLANPPYFAEFRIAEAFLRLAQRALKPGGRVFVVTKQPRWYRERMPDFFRQVEVLPQRAYHVAQGRA